MLNIIADTMMIATRTNPLERRDDNIRYLYLKDRQRREAKRQLGLALGRGLLK